MTRPSRPRQLCLLFLDKVKMMAQHSWRNWRKVMREDVFQYIKKDCIIGELEECETGNYFYIKVEQAIFKRKIFYFFEFSFILRL